ncbi:MAG TPA: hypothetical protein VK203_16745 [Nostocaceae cyanobacterium]|nr:hypothetical protein [Nostocaceae cyanobacterium]
MKSLKHLFSLPLISLSLLGLNFPLAALAKDTQPKTTQTAQTIFCVVVNIRTGQLALRESPGGVAKAGLDNGNVVQYLQNGPGVWGSVLVTEGPSDAVTGLKGWVNTNYLSCYESVS